MITRAEHLAWCKERALRYVEAGDLDQAFTSFASDIRKHPETAGAESVLTHIGMPLLLSGELDTAHKMRDFIEGFH